MKHWLARDLIPLFNGSNYGGDDRLVRVSVILFGSNGAKVLLPFDRISTVSDIVDVVNGIFAQTSTSDDVIQQALDECVSNLFS